MTREKPQRPQPDTSAKTEDELRAALKTRQELGREFEDEIVESFLSRVEDAIDACVEARVNEALRDRPARIRFTRPSVAHLWLFVALMAIVLTFAVPLATAAGSLVALAVVLASIVFAAVILILPERGSRSEHGSKPGEGA